jgi:acyl-CoA dehydrogenase
VPAEQAVARRLEAVRRIAADAAGPAADAVDREARFPTEAIDALKRERLLAALVPEDLGGLGCRVSEVAHHCQVLGQQCASTAMVYAMHQIQVACLVRHGLPAPYFRKHLLDLAERQALVASVTSEVGVGGDLRKSIAAVEPEGGRFRLVKEATTASYAAQADELLITCRRSAEAADSDQVLVIVRKPDYSLEATSTWNTLGMRGTCSPGFHIESSGSVEQVLPGPFADIATRTMVPFSHILWASCWLGIATDAVARAQAFVRGEARKAPGRVPPTALRLAEVSAVLQGMRALVRDATSEYEGLMDGPTDGDDPLATMGFALRINNLKVSASQLVVQVVGHALALCGVAAYRLDSRFSLGRQLRDAYSAALMIGNDRIYATNASLLLVHKDD